MVLRKSVRTLYPHNFKGRTTLKKKFECLNKTASALILLELLKLLYCGSCIYLGEIWCFSF